MKLLYLYVETWPERNMNKRIEVNFDCGYEFHYDSSSNSLTCASGKHELPEGFFSVSSEDRCVDSVSVIIGDNGSGKTSIASVLGRLFQRGRHLPEYICIYKQLGQLVLYYHFENRGKPDYSSITGGLIDAEQDPEYRDVIKHDHPFDIIYYSPYFVNNEVWRGEVLAEKVGNESLPLYDVSTTHLMLQPKATDKDIDRINAFRFEDQERILRFAHEYVNTFGKFRKDSDQLLTKNDECGPVLPPPVYAQFLVDTDVVSRFLNSSTAQDMSEIRDVVCNQDCNNPVWQLVSRILICLSLSEADGREPGIERHKGPLVEICREVKKTSERSSNKKRFDELREWLRLFACDSCLKKVLLPLVKVYGNSVLKHDAGGYLLYGQIDIADKDDYDHVIDVKRHMPELETWLAKILGRHELLMNVALANMSSGEMAYWTLFARLYDVFKMQVKKNDKRDILLLLDEAETTLHPVWQQQLVRNVIWFLEKYVNEQARDGENKRHVHVIFATHSPMILSDIPKGNVVFLMKDREAPSGKVTQSVEDKQKLLSELKDTFGANVFDLYRHPFFMAEGQIGTLSTKKLDDVVKKIHSMLLGQKSVMLTSEDWIVMELAGDPQVKKYFDSVKPLLQRVVGEGT